MRTIIQPRIWPPGQSPRPLLLLDSPRAAATALARGLLSPPEWVRLRYDAPTWPIGYARHAAEGLRLLAGTLSHRSVRRLRG